MSADSPRRNARGVPAIVPPQVVSDRSIIDSVAGFINDVTLAHQPQCDPKDTITWARFETAADISDSRFGDDWELEGNVAPPLLLILGYGQGVQVWAIPANGEAVEVLSWRHGIVSALRVLPTPSYAENGRADEPIDAYADKRPLMAICDGSTPAGSNPQFCAVNFISLKTGAQVKTIKFKNPVLDILANRSSIVITFHERIAVFDARSLEDRLSVTTCFPSPGINPNPVALGSRWMAYSENKLLHSKRSGGGCDGDGVSSYTATVLNAAKSFGKGLRELGEQVAAGLTGTAGSGMSSKSSSFDSATGDVRQPGVVTILDIKYPIKDVSPTSGTPVSINGSDPIVAHFIAHSEAVVAMEFDNSGMMLLTADRRGHDFHLFRIQPHPVGSSLAAVHHLYVLHRGDTSAKVQNITFSLDSRWVAVSTLRGTTHVFPVTPYGGPAGVRTHTSLHVVNKLSRFHRSAGLTADGRSSSPISHSDSTNFSQMLLPYHNPTLPPFPRPTIVLPLAQLRQPFALGSPPGSAAPNAYSKASNTRQRLSSLSDDTGKPLSVCAVFAKSRSWLLDPPNAAREAPHKIQRKAVDSLFVMAGHGALIQYDLDTKLATNVAKEKICDDTPIELEVEAKAQWNLGRKDGSLEIMAPLSSDNWLIKDRNSCMLIDSTRQFDDSDDRCDSWLSQVEIITHAGPHRRLWMGPQFVFKTYNTPSGSNLSHIDVEAVEIGVSPGPSTTCRPERSSPLNMPLSATGRSTVPVLIESGSYSSIEQSPKLMDRFRHEHMNSDYSVAHGDTRLKEDLADAMRESPSVSHKDTGGHPQRRRPSAAGSSRATASSSPSSSPKARSGGSGGVSSTSSSSSSAATLVGGGYASSSTPATATIYSSQYESLESLVQQQQQLQHIKTVSIEKVVNPLGTVTTITGSCDSGLDTDDFIKGVSAQDYVIHENCDESLFRPVVAIFCDERSRLEAERFLEDSEYTKPPEAIGNKLVVPVIEKAVDLELTKKESMKNRGRRQQQQHQHQQQIHVVKEESDDEVVRFSLADLNKKAKSDKKKQIKEEAIKKTITTQSDDKLTAKKSSTSQKKANVEEEQPKTATKNEYEMPKKKSSDNASKSKISEVRRTAEREALSDDKTFTEKHSDKAETKKESVVERKTSENIETRKLSVVERKTPDKDSKPKSSKVRKDIETGALSEKEPPAIEKASVVNLETRKSSDNDTKPKSSKVRRSLETIALSEQETSLVERETSGNFDTRTSSVEGTSSDTDSKSKSSKLRGSVEKDASPIVDRKTSNNDSKPKPLKVRGSLELDASQIIERKNLDNDSKPKSSKVRRGVESDAFSEGENSDNVASSLSLSVSLKVKKNEEPVKKTAKGRKSEEKESDLPPDNDSKTKPKESVAEESVKITKPSKTKEQTENEPLRTKPHISDEEEEKPIEFKRMTVTSPVKIKTLKIEKTTPPKVDIKSEEKTKSKTIEKKSKFEKESSEESIESIEVKGKLVKVEKTPSAMAKGRSKSQEEVDQVDSGNIDPQTTKKNTKDDNEKKLNEATGVSLAVELSNVFDLADSLLDILPDKGEDMKPCPVLVDVDKLKKKTDDDEVAPDLELDQKSNPKTNKSTPADKLKPESNLSEKESKKTSKKSKPDKTPTPPEPLPELVKVEEPIDYISKVTINKKCTIITVEEKTSDKPESSDGSKNLFETSPSLMEPKTKLKKKTKVEKAPVEIIEKPTVSTADLVEIDKTLSELKSSQLIEVLLPTPSTPSSSVMLVEKKLRRDKLSRLLELSSKESDRLMRSDKSNEMTGSKITIEPMKVDTFLSDLMDSQKSKSSPPDSIKSEESPKKTIGSPLKFVESFATPDVPVKKEKTKKKPTPGKVEKLSDKVESSFSGRLRSSDGIQFFDKFLQESAKASAAQPVTPWKPLSVAEDKPLPMDIDYPTLGKPMKMKKSQSPPTEMKEKCLTFTMDIPDEKKSKKSPKGTTRILEDLPSLQPLDNLPIDFLAPLPPLEPLEGADENISLINFESPLQEASKPIKEVEKTSPQFPKGFSADSIIFALCGSLHYENENSGKPVDSPLTLSFSDSTAHTTAEYKSLTENDDQYLSLEQSSQENVPSTSSSTCEDVTEAAYSSSGGDKVAIASGKTKNKQRRKKQLITAAPDDDEELRPLISKNDDVNLLTCSLTVCKGKTSATAIMKKETLPPLDNNQVNSDSSSSDQATTSEDPDDQICLNVHTSDATAAATGKSTDNTDKSAEDDTDLAASIQSPQQASQSQQQQQPNSSKKKLKRRKR